MANRINGDVVDTDDVHKMEERGGRAALRTLAAMRIEDVSLLVVGSEALSRIEILSCCCPFFQEMTGDECVWTKLDQPWDE